MSEGKKVSYFREVQNELKKVTWTSKEELILCTKVVIASTFLFGFGVYLVDVVVHSGLKLVASLSRMIFG